MHSSHFFWWGLWQNTGMLFIKDRIAVLIYSHSNLKCWGQCFKDDSIPLDPRHSLSVTLWEGGMNTLLVCLLVVGSDWKGISFFQLSLLSTWSLCACIATSLSWPWWPSVLPRWEDSVSRVWYRKNHQQLYGPCCLPCIVEEFISLGISLMEMNLLV